VYGRDPVVHRITRDNREMALTAIRRVGTDYASIVRSPRYFPLWLGQLVSNFGDTLHYIALVVLVFELSGQGLAVAGLVATEIIPVLVLGPIAGVVIDRFDRKSVLIGADLFRAALVVTLIWPQGVWHAYVVAAGLSAGGVFFNPTTNAVMPVLTTPEQRLAANSVSWSTTQLVQIVGASIAGGVIAVVGTAPAFALNAGSFVFSAALIARLHIPAHAGQISDGKSGLRSYFSDALVGFAYARRNYLMSRLLLVQSIASLAVGATGAMLVVLSERHLHQPPEGFAWLIAAIGVGALIGPLIPNALTADYRNAGWLFIPYVIRGIGDILLAIITPFPIALAILFVYGLNTSTGMVVFNSTIQNVIPESMRGRAFTLLDVDWSVMQLLSLAIGGVIVQAFGIELVYGLGGSLLVLAGLLGLRLLKSFTFVPEQAAS